VHRQGVNGTPKRKKKITVVAEVAAVSFEGACMVVLLAPHGAKTTTIIPKELKKVLVLGAVDEVEVVVVGDEVAAVIQIVTRTQLRQKPGQHPVLITKANFRLFQEALPTMLQRSLRQILSNRRW
jgi:bifunctional DNA-binding transcriptional regulator/antitoxin component of YhaV-PrlF toxin-antitoxin module